MYGVKINGDWAGGPVGDRLAAGGHRHGGAEVRIRAPEATKRSSVEVERFAEIAISRHRRWYSNVHKLQHEV